MFSYFSECAKLLRRRQSDKLSLPTIRENLMNLQIQSLAQKVSSERDPARMMRLVDELCLAIDNELAANRLARSGCRADCREHIKVPI